jgi:hypothetical protein
LGLWLLLSNALNLMRVGYAALTDGGCYWLHCCHCAWSLDMFWLRCIA